MKQPEIRAYLHDIVSSCRLVKDFTRDRSYTDYVEDVMLRSAVERQLTIAGEALTQAIKAEPDLAERISDVGRIIAFRNRLIHAYGILANDIVWGVVENNIDVLIVEVERILAERAR